MSNKTDYEVLIVGAGFGGIATAIELREAGIHDFALLEKHDGIGGTWYANRYPGIAVDIPAVFYSLSRMPFTNSSRFFPPGHEIQQYIERVVDAYGLRPRIRLNTRVEGARWDESTHLWRVTLGDGAELTARFVVGALGILEVPKLPDIPGVESFAGKTVHTATWDHDFDYSGKRIAVIGTGATALQLIPELAKVARHLTVFQRTPIWLAPKPDFDFNPLVDAAMSIPPVRKAIRGAIATGIDVGLIGALLSMRRLPRVAPYLTKAGAAMYKLWLRDDELSEKLTPTYAPGCKRPSMSNEYFWTFKQKDRVSLITEKIVDITERGVRTADGVEHEIDVLVCATGFRVCERGFAPVFTVHGENGVELGDYWHEHGYHAYQGVSAHGWPNLFLVGCGPNTIVPSSILVTIENNAAHARRAIVEARKRGATKLDVTKRAYDDFAEFCLNRTEGSMWLTAPCAGSNTYYVNYQGELAIRPTTAMNQWWGNRHFPFRDYEFTGRIGAVDRMTVG
ncbi:NAD(P)/FAD-dependent oxidoreductase [Nocardia sp. 2]|uniref:NAD(P)/FAD-dependent oxidoreductase n=1 Tax=Nocardia acididurans TaxID=2802282 RepID=A0ABS1M470_9NOCA|nr:NAD(P)/FAD-dependent oxidoreductase [Nocardia acididurans]MBL1075380.1 NAD(P)/FAD-dependent oxidoreductase [Nocardia acididurans]